MGFSSNQPTFSRHLRRHAHQQGLSACLLAFLPFIKTPLCYDCYSKFSGTQDIYEYWIPPLFET